MDYCDFGHWVRGTQIAGMSIEMNNPDGRDFMTFHTKDVLRPDVLIDSRTGTSRLVSIQGEIEQLLNCPILDGYASCSYYNGEWTTMFIVRSREGQDVTFTWTGELGVGDVEIREC